MKGLGQLLVLEIATRHSTCCKDTPSISHCQCCRHVRCLMNCKSELYDVIHRSISYVTLTNASAHDRLDSLRGALTKDSVGTNSVVNQIFCPWAQNLWLAVEEFGYLIDRTCFAVTAPNCNYFWRVRRDTSLAPMADPEGLTSQESP